MGKASKYFYVNVAQVIGVIGSLAIGWRYLDIRARELGIEKRPLSERIRTVFWDVR